MTMDVSLRLRLKNELSREAKVAERDLKELGDAARKLGSRSSNRLGNDIAQVSREAAKSESAVNRLGARARQLNSINTNTAEREIKSLGTAAVEARSRVNNLGTRLRQVGGDGGGKLGTISSRLSEIEQPASTLNTTMGALSGSARGAMTALGAFITADRIIGGLEQLSQKFKEVNREVAAIAVTVGMRTPEAMAKIQASNEALSIRYGRTQTEVNEARGNYAAAGMDLGKQEEILEPTLKAAVASKSAPGTISDAVIAMIQNLGIKEKEVPAALDMLSKGTDLGRFEVGAFARNLPKLATMYAGTGRQGLPALAELVTAAQVVMKSSGTQDIAANNLDNLIGKLSSPDTVGNFEDAGIDIKALKKRSLKRGTPYMLDVIDEVMRVTKGDEFQIGELFGDKEAKMALTPLITFRDEYNAWLKQIRDQSAGQNDQNFDFVGNTPFEKSRRREAALEATGGKLGEAYDRLISPLADRIVRVISPEYNKQRTVEEEPELLKQTSTERLRIENEILRLQGQQREMADGGQSLGPQINRLKAEMATLLEEEAAIMENVRTIRAEAGAEAVRRAEDAANVDLGKSTGELPIPGQRPGPMPSERPVTPQIEGKLEKDLSGSAEKAMNGYNERLTAEGDRAVAIAADKAAEMQRVLNFTAQPTIAPTFIQPGATGAPAAPTTGERHSSLQTNTGVTLNQQIVSPNSRVAALRAQREANRSVRMAQSRALGDLGPRTA